MSFLNGLRLRSLLADLSQFPSVQPITPAAGALIDLDFAASAEKMAMKLDSSASWAIAFAIEVHGNVFVSSNVQQRLAGLPCIIHALEFERVEPDSAAASLADVHQHVPNADLGQLIEASWAFHRN